MDFKQSFSRVTAPAILMGLGLTYLTQPKPTPSSTLLFIIVSFGAYLTFNRFDQVNWKLKEKMKTDSKTLAKRAQNRLKRNVITHFSLIVLAYIICVTGIILNRNATSDPIWALLAIDVFLTFKKSKQKNT